MNVFIRQLYSSLFGTRINSTRFSQEAVRLSWPSALNRIGWCRWIVNMSLIPLIRSSRPDFLAINLMNESRCGQTELAGGKKTRGWCANTSGRRSDVQRAEHGKPQRLKLNVTKYKGKDSRSVWLKCQWNYQWRDKIIRSALIRETNVIN